MLWTTIYMVCEQVCPAVKILQKKYSFTKPSIMTSSLPRASVRGARFLPNKLRPLFDAGIIKVHRLSNKNLRSCYRKKGVYVLLDKYGLLVDIGKASHCLSGAIRKRIKKNQLKKNGVFSGFFIITTASASTNRSRLLKTYKEEFLLVPCSRNLYSYLAKWSARKRKWLTPNRFLSRLNFYPVASGVRKDGKVAHGSLRRMTAKRAGVYILRSPTKIYIGQSCGHLYAEILAHLRTRSDDCHWTEFSQEIFETEVAWIEVPAAGKNKDSLQDECCQLEADLIGLLRDHGVENIQHNHKAFDETLQQDVITLTNHINLFTSRWGEYSVVYEEEYRLLERLSSLAVIRLQSNRVKRAVANKFRENLNKFSETFISPF